MITLILSAIWLITSIMLNSVVPTSKDIVNTYKKILYVFLTVPSFIIKKVPELSIPVFVSSYVSKWFAE